MRNQSKNLQKNSIRFYKISFLTLRIKILKKHKIKFILFRNIINNFLIRNCINR
jgi:hypothetical protein